MLMMTMMIMMIIDKPLGVICSLVAYFVQRMCCLLAFLNEVIMGCKKSFLCKIMDRSPVHTISESNSGFWCCKRLVAIQKRVIHELTPHWPMEFHHALFQSRVYIVLGVHMTTVAILDKVGNMKHILFSIIHAKRIGRIHFYKRCAPALPMHSHTSCQRRARCVAVS